MYRPSTVRVSCAVEQLSPASVTPGLYEERLVVAASPFAESGVAEPRACSRRADGLAGLVASVSSGQQPILEEVGQQDGQQHGPPGSVDHLGVDRD